jgi:hypothetical protein
MSTDAADGRAGSGNVDVSSAACRAICESPVAVVWDCHAIPCRCGRPVASNNENLLYLQVRNVSESLWETRAVDHISKLQSFCQSSQMQGKHDIVAWEISRYL